ncbi:MAG: DUF4012 domain-containing protein, partial [Actinomycetota bacterium]|nr:DUF4012 domain-containing protein [Actinomycetota bacterium]
VPSALSTPAALSAAFVSLVAASAPPSAPRRHATGALAGALVATALLHLDHPGDARLVGALAALVVVPAALATARRAGRTRRRLAGAIAVIAGLVTIVALALAGVVGLRARGAVADGTAAARTATAAMAAGDATGARRAFTDAAASFDDAATLLGGWWTAPARVLPAVGPNVAAAAVMTTSGAELATHADATLDAIDTERLAVSRGAVPLDALEAAAGPMADARASLAEHGAALDRLDRSLLLPPTRRGLDELSEAIEEVEPTVETLALATRSLPAALGAGEQARWLVLLATPAESRFAGGFVGSWALVTADDGALSVTDSGPISELNPPRGTNPPPIDGPDDYALRWNDRYHPELFFQNVTASAHFPSVGSVAAQLWSRTGGESLHGVVYLDPEALAALVGLLDEPVALPDGSLLDADTTVPYLLRGQYAAFAGDNVARREMLGVAMAAAGDALTTAELGSVGEVADALAPVAAGGHLMVAAFDDDTSALVERAGLDGSLVPDEAAASDVVSLRSANASANKIDTFLDRSLRWSAEVADDGTLRVDGEITVTNRAPTTGYPDYVIGNEVGQPVGSVTTLVSLHTRHRLVSSSVDGVETPLEQRSEEGLFAYTAIVTIPAGGSSTIRFRLRGEEPVGDRYELVVVGQPTVNPDRVVVTLDGPRRWRATGISGADGVVGDRAVVLADSDAARLVTVGFEPS